METEAKIFIAVDSTAAKESLKKYGYVLEFTGKNGIQTREGFGETIATYHAAVLTAMVHALERFNRPCEITICADDAFVLNMLNRNLEVWATNGYRNAKGEAIKNMELWMRVGQLINEHNILTLVGEHEYSAWLKAQM